MDTIDETANNLVIVARNVLIQIHQPRLLAVILQHTVMIVIRLSSFLDIMYYKNLLFYL